MPIKDSLTFTFNGITSASMGVINCTMSSGLYDEMFIAPRTLKQTRIRGREKPYNYGVEYTDSLKFSLNFAFEDGFTDDKLREISRYLITDNFCPMTFENYPNRIYYCLVEDKSDLTHNGITGYITVNFVCNSSHSYLAQVTNTFVVSTGTSTVSIVNNGDISVKPEIEITKTGAGLVTVTNLTNSQTFTISNLVDLETVYINCETEQILTNLSNTYRYSDFVGDFLELNRLTNSIKIDGNCSVQIRFQPKLLT